MRCRIEVIFYFYRHRHFFLV